jgi:predicted ATPase
LIHLESLRVQEFSEQDRENFPFNLEVVRSLRELIFASPVTFFVGENGSGKSTILESLACAINSVTVGSESVRTDRTLSATRKLAQYYRFAWRHRTHKGFFLRAEDFFGYAKQMRKTQEELRREMMAVEQEYQDRPKPAADLARLPYVNELAAIEQRYGDGLDHYSHGESFLALFQTRFVPGGLYLLDEPEAALSPTRQLTFISALKRMVGEDSQFVIATHSPIILAFPEATIQSFDGGVLKRVDYEQLEHVNLTRDFLDRPQSFLRHL